MKWITKEQVKKHATTPAKALNISIKHWQQIVDTTAKEMRTAPLGLFTRNLCGFAYITGQVDMKLVVLIVLIASLKLLEMDVRGQVANIGGQRQLIGNG